MKRVRVVTLAIALAFVVLAFSVQPAAAASRYESLRSYMNGRWDPVRGGYSLPDDVVRVDETYGAIVIMDETGTLATRPPPIDITKVLNFTSIYQWLTGDESEPRYGGFMEFLLGPVTAERTHWGMQLWQILKAEPNIPGSENEQINETAVLVYVNKTQTTSGGFSSEPGLAPDIVSTYHSLATLAILDEMYTELNPWSWINETATLEWIESCRVDNGFKLSPTSNRIGVTPTAAGLLALDVLGELASYSHSGSMSAWLLERQIAEYDLLDYVGGFEEGNATEDPNLQSSYWAVNALEATGVSDQINQTILQEFVLNCQTESGAFGITPGIPEGNLVLSSYAVEILGFIGNPANILSSSADPFSTNPAWLDWRVVVIGLVVILALVLALLSIKMD